MSSPLYAGTVICSGKVEQLAYHADNSFMIKLDSMNVPVFFCSPEIEWAVVGTEYKTGPETCKLLYASFLSAKSSGAILKTIYFDGGDVPERCDGWGDWKRANIRYFNF